MTLDAQKFRQARLRARRKPSESREQYLARLNQGWGLEANRAPLAVGYSNTATQLVPWRQSATEVGTAPLTAEEREQARQVLTQDLAPIRRRSATERVDAMLEDLVSQAELSYRLLGRVEFPRSMMDAIGAELWKMGLPEVRQHLERYAKELLAKVEQKARRNPRTDAPKDLLHNVRPFRTASEPR